MNGQCEQPSGHPLAGDVRRKSRQRTERPISQRYPESVWDTYKDEIRSMYLTENQTCKDVAKRMGEIHGFYATVRQYKNQLDRWDYHKNTTHREWLQAMILLRELSDQGYRVRGFTIHNSYKSTKELHRYITEKKMTEEDFLLEARRESVKASGVRCEFEAPETETARAATKPRITPTAYFKDSAACENMPREISSGSSKDSGYATMRCEATPRESGYHMRRNEMTPGDSGNHIMRSETTPRDIGHNTIRGETPPPSSSISTGSNSLVHIATPSTRDSKSFSSYESQLQDASPTAETANRVFPHDSRRESTQIVDNGLVHAEHVLSSADHEVQIVSSTMDLSAHFAKKSNRITQLPVACDSVQQEMGLMGAQTIRPGALKHFALISDIASWSIISSPQLVADTRACLKCQLPLQDHTPLPQDWLYGDESDFPQRLSQQPLGAGVYTSLVEDDASTFQICCFSACLSQTQKRYEIFSQSLQRANDIFQKMLLSENRLALLSVLIALTILHVHDQGEISASIIRSFVTVCKHIRGENDAWTVCIEWLAYAAGRKLKDCHIEVDTLGEVLTRMQERYGPLHENTIVAQYCYAFQLAFTKRHAEAEVQYKQLIEICEETLAPDHIQTISCRNGLSRVQSRQGGDQTAAIETLKTSLESQPLGPNHPFRIETRKRLAILYQKAGNLELAEAEYWAVLRGRLKTLGKNHEFTEDARLRLERLLKKMAKYNTEVMERIQTMFQEGNDSTDFDAFACPLPNSTWDR